MYTIFNRTDKSEGFKFFVHDAEHALFVDGVDSGIELYENRLDIGNRIDGNKMMVTNFSFFHPQWLHFKLSDNQRVPYPFFRQGNKAINRKWHFYASGLHRTP